MYSVKTYKCIYNILVRNILVNLIILVRNNLVNLIGSRDLWYRSNNKSPIFDMFAVFARSSIVEKKE